MLSAEISPKNKHVFLLLLHLQCSDVLYQESIQQKPLIQKPEINNKVHL